jgi:hypothetical protein
MTKQQQRTQRIIAQMRILAETRYRDRNLQQLYMVGFLAEQLSRAMGQDSKVYTDFWDSIRELGLTQPDPN